MATVDGTVGGTTKLPGHLSKQLYKVSRHYDFSENNQSSSDVIQLINIPANHFVLAVFSDVEVAEGGTLTFDAGDGADPNGWDDAVDGDTVAVTQGDGAFAAQTAGGKLYTAADTLDIVLDNDADAAKIGLIALVAEIA